MWARRHGATARQRHRTRTQPKRNRAVCKCDAVSRMCRVTGANPRRPTPRYGLKSQQERSGAADLKQRRSKNVAEPTHTRRDRMQSDPAAAHGSTPRVIPTRGAAQGLEIVLLLDPLDPLVRCPVERLPSMGSQTSASPRHLGAISAPSGCLEDAVVLLDADAMPSRKWVQ